MFPSLKLVMIDFDNVLPEGDSQIKRNDNVPIIVPATTPAFVFLPSTIPVNTVQVKAVIIKNVSTLFLSGNPVTGFRNKKEDMS